MEKSQIRAKIEELLKELSGAVQIRSMYSHDHNLTQKVINKLYYVLEDLLFVEKEITIGIIGNEAAYGKEPFYEVSQQIQGLIKHLKSINAVKIGFLKGMTKDELAEFISVLATNEETVKMSGGIEKLIEGSGIKSIAIGKIGYAKGEEAPPVSEEEMMKMMKQNFSDGEDVLKEVASSILENKSIDLKGIRSFVNSILANLISNKASLLILTAVKSHDEYSFVHNINVAIFTLIQAEGMGLEQSFLNEIGVAALLHDVGKISIPGEILRKQGALTPEEFDTIKSHTVCGAKIILESPDINIVAALSAFGHHIRYDMSGYPDRLFGGPTDLATMMITISDFYDALRSKRAYSTEVAPEKTYDEMKKLSGKHFHPDLLDHFFSIIGVYPPGTIVELDTKEVGLVVKSSAIDIKRPQVEILYGADGKMVGTHYTVNLLEKDTATGNYKRSVVQSILPSEKFKVPEKYKQS